MSENLFLKEVSRGSGSAYTENGAKSYASIGTTLLDQFGKAGTNRGRDINLVFADQAALYNENPEAALKFPFYLRMITRQTKLMNGEKTEKVQKGQGARDEAFKRLLWFEKFHPDIYYKNLWLVPIVGSWKDIWVLLSMSEKPNKTEYFKVIAEGIQDENNKDLVKKYMPRIRSNNKCATTWAKSTNEFAKEFAKFAGWSYRDYRIFKASGVAHKFQTYMCSGLYSKINWATIPGKALLNMVSGNFLKNHGLEASYEKWLETQPVAKYNGYVYEFARKLRNYYGTAALPKTTKMTIDKQFANLIKTAKADQGGIKGNVWVALDTSGSMNITIDGVDLRAVELAKSLAIYFATLNEGAFHNYVMGFDNRAWLYKLTGESFTEKWYGGMPSVGGGGTNFQCVIDEIIKVKKEHPEIPESDYPQCIVVVSDMQFSPAGGYSWNNPAPSQSEVQTNYEAMVSKLRKAGFSEKFLKDWKMVWWYCVNRETEDYPSNMDCPGTYMFSGFDPAVVTLLLGGDAKVVDEKTGEVRNMTMQEMVDNALNQEVLTLLSL
jgi:hypothetical protein